MRNFAFSRLFCEKEDGGKIPITAADDVWNGGSSMAKKRKYVAVIILLILVLSVGAAFLGYHLASEYKITLVNAFESALNSFKEKISSMENEVQNITEQSNGKLTEKEHQCYICSLCGWVYDPKKGCPEQGIIPNTPFMSVPNDWLCPNCGAAKTDFKEGTSKKKF